MKTTPLILILSVLAGLAPATWAADAPTMELLRTEADHVYQEARKQPEQASAKAKQLYARAATLYEQLVASGADNHKLHHRLGECMLYSGKPGKAIAALKRAEVQGVFDSSLRDKLTEARTLRDGHAPAPHATTWSARAQNINRSVLLETRVWIVLIAWCLLWLWLLLAFFKRTPKWRWPILVTVVIFLLAAGSIAWDVSQRPRVDTGVVIAGGAVLRTSNSQTAPAVSPDAIAQGVELTVLAHRERWIEVKLSSGATGWLPRQDVEVIEPLLKGPFKNGSFLP
jgi:hypothetical protein